ncbi:MAG: hypothetical protein N3J91_04765 [Verrucomicrobiae bacterium]|nr:hypothetical protein [Verrucomicrobiae bacterium]
MKTKKHRSHKQCATEPAQLQDALPQSTPWIEENTGPMIRTQIYLSASEHRFLQAEAARRGVPMAAVIRSLIDERMNLPEEAWSKNPLLAPPADASFVGPEDGVINHDHYIYGTPKRHVKRGGQWVPAPPLPEDYYENEKSRKAYDQSLGVKNE